MATGKVKWFNFKNGYGFITTDEGEKDIFVHISALKASGLRGLQENQTVEYELKTDENGKTSAINISVKE